MHEVMKEYIDFGDDSGPRDAWFFDWLQTGTSSEFFQEDDRWENWCKGTMPELIQSNHFVFFSRKRWDSLSNLLPTMEEMLEATCTNHVPYTGLQYTADEIV